MSVEVVLIVVFIGAFVSPFVSRAFRMPVPVGELLFGLALGHFIGSSTTPEVVSFLAEFGFLLLMFLAGLEIDFDLLEKTEGKLLLLYTLYTVSIFGISLGIAVLLGINPVVFLILSLISIGLMVATLKDMGMLSSPLAKKVLIVGVIGEVVSLFALTFMEKLGHFHSLKDFILDMGEVFLFLLGFFLFFRVMKVLLWWFPEVVKKLTYEEDPSEAGVRLSLAMMFVASVLAHLAGIEAVLGAFLAGAMVSFFVRKKHDLEEKLSSIGYGFLIPIFFIKTGMEMDLSGLNLETLKGVAVLIVLMLLVRLLPSFLLLPAGFSPRELPLTALFLAYPFTLMIAGAEIGRSAGLLKEEEFLLLFLSAGLSSLLFPWIIKGVAR
ncbi:MAG: sodium:proton antiporter [Aquificae bacterium]|nr:sodium:proton antiporter [Aquificota bacterium]